LTKERKETGKSRLGENCYNGGWISSKISQTKERVEKIAMRQKCKRKEKVLSPK